MSKRTPPSSKEIARTLKKARVILGESNSSYELDRLLKSKKTIDILANAILSGELDVPAKRLAIVYAALAEPTHLASLSSLAVFEHGLKSTHAPIRKRSDAVMAAQSAGESGDALAEAALAEAVLSLVAAPTSNPPTLPMDVRRWSLAELAESLSASEADVDTAVTVLIATNGGTRVAFARRHGDGRCSFSRQSVFEALIYPSAFEIEQLVAGEDFKALNTLLAAAKVKRVAADKSAPKITWRDGTKVTLAAQAWMLTHTRRPGHQRADRKDDVNVAVPRALDLLRDTLSEESARELCAWVAESEGKDAPRCVVPGRTACQQVASSLLAGIKVSDYVLDDIVAYPHGRRALLHAEVAWPKSRHPRSTRMFNLCHDGWPSLSELGEDAAMWNELADRFLAECAEVAHVFPWSLFRASYVDHSLMGPKVRRFALLTPGALATHVTIDDAGELIGDAPRAVVLSLETPALTGRDESWRDAAQRTLDAELEARGRIADFSGLVPFTKARFARALKALGFVRVLESASFGTKYEDRMELRRVEIRVSTAEGGVRLTRVSLVVQETTYVEVTDEGLRFVGAWRAASDDQRAIIDEALGALGLEDASPPPPNTGWSLSLVPSQGRTPNALCLACRLPLEDFKARWARYARLPEPTDAQAAQEWREHLIGVGRLHLSCA